MPPEKLTALLDQLWSIYNAEQTDSRYLTQLDYAEFVAIVRAPLEKFAPDFSSKGWNAENSMPAAKFAVAMFLYTIQSSLTGFPIGWQRPFREAFDRGEIDGIAFGAAVRLIYTYNSPERAAQGRSIPTTLVNLRLSDPTGLMIPEELQLWRALPDRVTIYRGALTDTPREAAMGISWSLSRGYSAAHLYRRMLPAHDATEVRKLLGLKTPPPQLLSIVAPRSAIIATICSGDREVLVDYEKLDLTLIKRLPTNNLLMQAITEKLGGIGRMAAMG